MSKGIIIEIEGTDASGKQTQATKLYERLKNELEGKKEVCKASFPNYDSQSSGPVKMYLHSELSDNANGVTAYQVSAFYAVDRVCEYKRKGGFGEVYVKGGVVVLDRYVGSNKIHQACKIDDEEEKKNFLKWQDDLEFEYLELPKPDVVIFLDMPLEISTKLSEKRELKAGSKDIHEQDKEYMKKAYESGHYIANKYNWNIISCVNESGDIKTIDEIHEEIYELVKKYM